MSTLYLRGKNIIRMMLYLFINLIMFMNFHVRNLISVFSEETKTEE